MSIKKTIALLACLSVCQVTLAEEFTAKSWLVADYSGAILSAEQPSKPMSIASITKLMTVLVILDQQPDIEKEVRLKHGLASSKRISKKEKSLPIRTLVELSMVSSDNMAAANLCAIYKLKKAKNQPKLPCVSAMNAKAKELGMMHTVFVEPTGLSEKNISTAEDLVKLLRAASRYELLVNSSKTSRAEIKMRQRTVPIKNTNSLVGTRSDITLSKTGWTRAAGGCIAMIVGANNNEKIIVVLGSKNVKTRILEADKLIHANTEAAEDTHSKTDSNINTNNNRELQ